MVQCWGTEVSVDLTGCDPEAVSDAERVRMFAERLCDLMCVKRFGETIVVRFGVDPRIAGLSLVQLIESSLVSGHFVDSARTAYINVFSCGPVDTAEVAAFCAAYFGAKGLRYTVNYR
jgi:S-adenosylmethionine/arginine decarboxylase-like enzyme